MRDFEIPLGSWLPDRPDHNNPGVVDAKNVYRKDGAYFPFHALEYPGGSQSGDLGTSADAVYHAISANKGGTESYAILTSTGRIVVAELDPLLVNSTIVQINDGQQAGFVDYDSDIYFFAEDQKQYKSSSGGAWTQVATNTQVNPAAAAKVGRFIMTGFRQDIKWSGFNQPESWDISELTQAGEATIDYPELGFITGILGGRTNYIFQEYGISRLTYVGPPTIWDIQIISREVGAVMGSPIEVGGITYFIGATSTGTDTIGFTTLAGGGGLAVYKTNGVEVVPVSEGAVSDWVTENLATGAGRERYRLAVYDQTRRQIIWRSGTGAETHKFLCMNVDTEEFSYFEAGYRALMPGPHHHEDNAGNLVAIDKNGATLYFGPMSGDTLEATVSTGHLASAGTRTHLETVEPIYIGSGATVAVSGKDRLRAASSFGSYSPENATTGIAPARVNGRSTAVSIRHPAATTWERLSGFVASGDVEGKR